MPNPVVHAPQGSCKRGKLEWVVKGRFCKRHGLKSIPLRGPSNLLFQASMNNSHEQRPTLYAMPSSSRFRQMRSVKWIAKAGFCKGGGLKSLPLCSLPNLLLQASMNSRNVQPVEKCMAFQIQAHQSFRERGIGSSGLPRTKAGFCKSGGLKSMPLRGLSNLLASSIVKHKQQIQSRGTSGLAGLNVSSYLVRVHHGFRKCEQLGCCKSGGRQSVPLCGVSNLLLQASTNSSNALLSLQTNPPRCPSLSSRAKWPSGASSVLFCLHQQTSFAVRRALSSPRANRISGPFYFVAPQANWSLY